MIIATSQEFAAVDCCGCLPMECGEPRKECRSIRVVPCGYINYNHTEVGKFPGLEPEWCGYWETVDRVWNRNEWSGPTRMWHPITFVTSFLSGESHDYYHNIDTVDTSNNVCVTDRLITHDKYRYVHQVQEFEPFDLLRDHTENFESTYTTSTGCVGTQTSVDLVRPAHNFTIPWNSCDFFDLEGDYLTASTGDDSVTFTYEYSEEGYSATISITYSGRVTFNKLFERLDALNFEDHSNGIWCSSQIMGGNTCVGTPASVTKSGYRFGVPYTAEDMPRSVFEAQWDIYAFPHGWLAWQALVEAFNAAVIAHAEWVIIKAFYDANIGAYNAAMILWWDLAYAWDDYDSLHYYWTLFPGDFPEGEPQPPEEELGPAPTPPPWPGSEPIIPADPGSWVESAYNTCDDADGPALVSSESWIWGGDMGAPNADPVIFAQNPEQWSPWFDMPMPSLPALLSDAWDEDGNFKSDCINRDFLVCNMMTKCYNSTRMGVAPTIHQPIYIPPAV